MSKIHIVPFRSFHLEGMDLRDWDFEYLGAAPELAKMSAEFFEKNGVGFTAIAPEGIVGAAGACRIFIGTWETWAYTTPLFPKYGMQVHRRVKKFIDDFFMDDRINRVQCMVDSKNPAAVRWAEVLFGLENKSLLRRYGPEGQDFYMFARVRGNK